MPFDGQKTNPGQTKNGDRFWLRADGVAFKVDDHLKAAQYAKAALADDDRPFPWGYNEMFRRGWCRVHIEDQTIWADFGEGASASPEQASWLEAVAHIQSAGVMSALGNGTAAGGVERVGPTNDFLKRHGSGE